VRIVAETASGITAEQNLKTEEQKRKNKQKYTKSNQKN